MAVTAKTLVESLRVDINATVQYTATNCKAIIDKATATNGHTSAVTLNVWLVPSGQTAGATNLVVAAKTIQPNECYTLPELVGQVLSSGDFIETTSGTDEKIVLRVSGREIT